MRTWFHERRAHERGNGTLSTYVAGDAWRGTARVANLARAGACVVLDRPGTPLPSAGDRVSLRFELPPDPRVVDLLATVAWARHDGPRVRMGLTFAAIDSTTKGRIDRWVELVRAKASTAA